MRPVAMFGKTSAKDCDRSMSPTPNAALIEGETSGASTPFEFEAFIAKKRAGDAPR
jgi:hypothetical protein